MGNKIIVTTDDVLELLDDYLVQSDSERWSAFYSDTRRKCPFFTDSPDENLVELFTKKAILPPAKVLELGCGKGRNAIFLSNNGFNVDAIDFSEAAINAAKAKVAASGKKPNFICASILTYEFGNLYDVVYDSGCFHHIAPHRRPKYLHILNDSLRQNGIFGLVCFSPEGGSGLSDIQVYEERSLKGGLAYSEETIREIFKKSFDIVEIRRMRKQDSTKGMFGEDFLWACVMRKK